MRYQVMIGGGATIFSDDRVKLNFELSDLVGYSSGVELTVYRPATWRTRHAYRRHKHARVPVEAVGLPDRSTALPRNAAGRLNGCGLVEELVL